MKEIDHEGRQRFAGENFDQIAAMVERHFLESAMQYDLNGSCFCAEHKTDSVLLEAMELVAPGLKAREDKFALDEDTNPDEMLCIIEVRTEVSFVVGFLMAAKALSAAWRLVTAALNRAASASALASCPSKRSSCCCNHPMPVWS